MAAEKICGTEGKMNRMNFIKGMGAGLMVGAAMGMLLVPDKKTGRRRLSKMFRAASDVIEDLSGAIGL